MKKYLVLALLALCPVALFAADMEQTVAEGSCGSGTMWIPEGSNIITGLDNTLQIETPEGWIYVGRDSSGLAQRAVAAGCSCTCTSSSGKCMPSVFKGDCSCTAQDGCTACSLSTGAAVISNVEGPNDHFFTEGDLKNGGYINMNEGVRFAREGEELRMAFDAMFELEEVSHALESFLGDLYEGAGHPQVIDKVERFEAPEGYDFVTLNVFGRAGVVLMPEWAVTKAMVAGGGGGGGSCSCSSGTCTYDSAWTPKGTLHYCDGDCSGTCTLSMSNKFATDELSAALTMDRSSN